MAARISALLKLARAVGSTLDRDAVLHCACEAAVELVAADHSALVIFDQDLRFGTVVAEYPPIGAVGKQVDLQSVPIEERLLERHDPVPIPDVDTEDGLGPVRATLRS